MPALPCPPELWPRLSPLLDAALELPPAERAAWLAALPSSEAALRPYLERLLATPTRVRLEAPVLPDRGTPAFHPGQQIGGHVLEHLLGTGGMGEVWLARRADGALRRPVALKLPHSFLLAGT